MVLTILKNMKDSWDDYSHIYGKIKMFETTNQISYPQCPHFCRLTPILVGLECSTHRVGCAGRRTETASSTWGWRWTRNRLFASKKWGRCHLIDLDRFVYTTIAMIIFIVIIYIYIIIPFINYHYYYWTAILQFLLLLPPLLYIIYMRRKESRICFMWWFMMIWNASRHPSYGVLTFLK